MKLQAIDTRKQMIKDQQEAVDAGKEVVRWIYVKEYVKQESKIRLFLGRLFAHPEIWYASNIISAFSSLAEVDCSEQDVNRVKIKMRIKIFI